MTKGTAHYVREAWKKPDTKTLRERMIKWRKDPVQVKVEKPLRIDRARALGYKAKKGVIIIRIKIKRGGHKRSRPNKGRRSKRLHARKNLKMSYKWIAENRVQKKHKNLEVLNSYVIGRDGMHYFYEVICIDPSKPEIKNDRTLKWVIDKANKKRTLRGKTSSGRKSRGLRSKNPQNKARPSVRSGKRRGKQNSLAIITFLI
jgi:large subunit ribosomal protein L15e